MKAKLAGIASHTGMAGVFRLHGADIYRVLDVEPVPGVRCPAPAPQRQSAGRAARVAAAARRAATDLAALLERRSPRSTAHFDIRHAMVLMLDGAGRRLYTVASRGYAASGVGSEIAFGQA